MTETFRDDRIRQHRAADATVTLNLDGAPLAGREVTLEQTRHKFLFGCTGFELMDHANGTSDDPELDARKAEQWEGLFDSLPPITCVKVAVV